MRPWIFALFLLLIAAPLNCGTLEDAFEKYARLLPEKANIAPGRTIGNPQGSGESAIDYPWKYRQQTYELHFQDAGQLARSIHAFAVCAKDVSPDLPKEKFFRGVKGFHYSADQICSCLNSIGTGGLSDQERDFVNQLLADKVIQLSRHGFESASRIKHILGAAPGKNRTFAENLRHERLHIFWDEDSAFRARENKRWEGLTAAEKLVAKNILKNYNQENEAQLMEEWAIHRAEILDMDIKNKEKQ